MWTGAPLLTFHVNVVITKGRSPLGGGSGEDAKRCSVVSDSSTYGGSLIRNSDPSTYRDTLLIRNRGRSPLDGGSGEDARRCSVVCVSSTYIFEVNMRGKSSSRVQSQYELPSQPCKSMHEVTMGWKPNAYRGTSLVRNSP